MRLNAEQLGAADLARWKTDDSTPVSLSFIDTFKSNITTVKDRKLIWLILCKQIYIDECLISVQSKCFQFLVNCECH